ncbi:hypothetical protein N0V90_002715 [Kalmusia sp. IMI 367209]|nr:hypothetical protein N0V90_002715 [Kalmusia sp. IMI 367209]
MRYRLVDKSGKILKKADGTERWSSDSVKGWIAPPTIVINNRKSMSATITLKFIANPDGPGDSQYTYWLGSGPDAEEVSEPINNWSISWDADLSSQEIQQLQEDIALPNDVKSVLHDYVYNESFLVSSIFCLLQSAQLVNTFRGYDSEGKELSSGQWSTSFVKCLADWFDFDRKSQATPTPRNPFVLGYGIHQRLPPAPGTPLFIPRHFQFTTSANNNTVASGKSSLNFAIVTKDDRRVDLKTDGNAGNWQPSLIVQAGLNRDEADGVMVLSNGIFFNQYIEPFFISAFRSLGFRNEVAEANKDNDDAPAKNWSTTDSVTRAGQKYTRNQTWQLKINAHNTTRNGLAIQERAVWTGTDDFEIVCSSDPIPTWEHQNDIQRAGSIVINAKCFADFYAETNTRGGRDDLWADMAHVKFQAHLRLTYIVHANKDGGWSIVHDPSKSIAPSKNSQGKVDYEQSEPPDNADTGIWGWTTKAGYFGTFGGTGADGMLSQMADWNSADIGNINNKLAEVYKTLQTKIIMPAGNVLQFTGFNVDGQGNVYCPVHYYSIYGGEQFTIGT